jgi:hypothetical protein
MGNLFRRAAQGARNLVGRITGGQVGTRQVTQRTSGGGTGRGTGSNGRTGGNG